MSGSRQGWPRRRSPGQRAGPGRHWAPGFAGRARQPAAPSPCVQRAQGARRRCRRFQGRLPGLRGPHGPPPASLSQALKPYKSIHSHLLQALGSRAGSAGTEQKTKAVGEGETLPRKAVWAPGSCSGGSATPARRLQDHSPRLAGSTLPTASRGPRDGPRRTAPQASARKGLPGSETSRKEAERLTPAALLPLQINNTRDPEDAAVPSAGLPRPAVPRLTFQQRRENSQGGQTTRALGSVGTRWPRRAHSTPGKRLTTHLKATLVTVHSRPSSLTPGRGRHVGDPPPPASPRSQRRAEAPVSWTPSHGAADADGSATQPPRSSAQ